MYSILTNTKIPIIPSYPMYHIDLMWFMSSLFQRKMWQNVLVCYMSDLGSQGGNDGTGVNEVPIPLVLCSNTDVTSHNEEKAEIHSMS